METATGNKEVNRDDLETKVKAMYKEVASNPYQSFHFELGRVLAEKLGYDSKDLDQIPSESVDSFAGVGYYFDIANMKEGERVLDLGSGSGMDSFLAARKVGVRGEVHGIDMTDEQLAKAERLRDAGGFNAVTFHKGFIESLPFETETFDLVISNGVINLSAEKEKVFQEISRVLKPTGRMAIADIVSEKELPDTIVCNATLWASCIGGATQEDHYKNAIEDAGMEVLYVQTNSQYQFISKSAKNASKDYGVKSVSLVAKKNPDSEKIFL